jgi:Putative peptidoglycan binding domain
MSGVSKSEYIRWVKGTLNRLLGASLPDDGSNTPEYRMWLMSFQTNQKLTVNAQVDLATQNALIKRNRVHDAYVRWVQNALLISGEGIRVGGKAIVANGYWGSDTEQAVKDFQSKHENMKGDGWVGAKTERALMLRTGTVPPGRTRVLRGDPGYIPVFNDDGPLGPADPADDIPDLSIGFRFKGSAGVDLSVEKFGIGSGLLELDDLWNRKTIVLSYAALGLGLSPVPASISYSSMNMASVGRIYPNPVRGQDELTLDDITGWCLIYQGQFTVLGLPGGTGTLMFLSLGAGLVPDFSPA